MKKLFMGAALLTAIGILITSSQLSCIKGTAQTSTSGLIQLNLVLFNKKVYFGSGTNSSSNYETWLMNIDGNNQRKINFSVPGAVRYGDAKLSPDGKTIVFTAMFPSSVPNYDTYRIYSCDIDGKNNKLLISGSFTDRFNFDALELSGVH